MGRLWMCRRLAIARVGTLALLGGCTLTAEEFQPELATAEVRPGSDGDTGTCAEGDECCARVSCPRGESCREGSCEPNAGTDGGGASCEGADCPLSPIPLAQSCADGAVSGDETARDC